MQIVPVETMADQIVIADLQVFHDLSSMINCLRSRELPEILFPANRTSVFHQRA